MSVSESEPLEIFLYAIKSQITKERYKSRLANFFEFMELDGDLSEQSKRFMTLAQKNGKSWVFANMMKFMSYHKERAERGEISGATIRNYYKPVKLFLEMNDFELSWKRIARGLPKARKHAADRAPTLEEIQKLIEYPDRRIKAIVYVMCSSGIRLGAWDYLRWRHITPIKQDDKIVAAKITVYAGDEEQYDSFITQEAFDEMQKWMDTRAKAGENITKDSWLMRDLWNIEKHARGLVTVPKQLRSAGIKRLMERALFAQGIRTKLPQGQRRYEFQADHGFRKFFKTHAEQDMRPINVEMLMGHSTGVSDSYYRPNQNELLQDYLRAIPELTISKENRLLTDTEKLKEHSSEIEETKNEIARLRDEIKKIKMKSELAELLKQGIAQWAEDHPDQSKGLSIAKADFRNAKGLDEYVEHLLTEHDGNLEGVKEALAKAQITLNDEKMI